MTRSYARNAINDPQIAADIRAAISGKPRLKRPQLLQDRTFSGGEHWRVLPCKCRGAT